LAVQDGLSRCGEKKWDIQLKKIGEVGAVEVNTKQAIWIWTQLEAVECLFVNAGFIKNNREVDLKDAGCTLRINTCLADKNFPMREKIERLAKQYEEQNA